MKINLIPIGTRFEYEGQIYTKTGPITATAESGGLRMIPRHATLRAIGEGPLVTAEASVRMVDAAQVRVAFEAYHAVALRLTEDFARAELEQARQRFLSALEA